MVALAASAEEDDGVKVQVTTAGNEDVVDREREERMIAVGVRGGPPATSVAVVQSRLFDDVPSILRGTGVV